MFVDLMDSLDGPHNLTDNTSPHRGSHLAVQLFRQIVLEIDLTTHSFEGHVQSRSDERFLGDQLLEMSRFANAGLT